MSDFSVKRLLRSVPQPYKTWIARALLVPFFVVMVPFAAIVESAKWCAGTAVEIIDAWREVRHW
jgi:hypothetical protein